MNNIALTPCCLLELQLLIICYLVKIIFCSISFFFFFFITVLDLLKTSHFFNLALPPPPCFVVARVWASNQPKIWPNFKAKGWVRRWSRVHVLCASPSLRLCPLLAVASKLLDVLKTPNNCCPTRCGTFETMSLKRPLSHFTASVSC